MKKWFLLLMAIVLMAAMCVSGNAESNPEYSTDIGEVLRIAADIRNDHLYAQKVVLHYPDVFQSELIATINKIDEGVVISASTVIAEKEVGLYTLAISQEEIMDGALVGEFVTESGASDLMILYMNEILPKEWSEDEFMAICELQETVNELLEQQ